MKSGYDEIGALSTIFEFHFDSVQEEYAERLRINTTSFSWFLAKPMIELLIVPIRWTYSIGFFPFITLMSWVTDNVYLLYILHNILSVMLMHYSYNKMFSTEPNGSVKLAIFVVCVCSSSVLVHWQYTISSYSYVISLGILYSLLARDFFNRTEYTLSARVVGLLPLLSYQIIPYIFVLGLMDLFRSRFGAATLRFWVPVALTSSFALLFLKLRASISGKHSSAGWQFQGDLEFWKNSSFLNVNEFIWEAGEYVGAIFNFYFRNQGSLGFWYRTVTFTELEIFVYLSVLVFLAGLVFVTRKHSATKSFVTVITVTMILYATNALPTIVSRHFNFVMVCAIIFAVTILTDCLFRTGRIRIGVQRLYTLTLLLVLVSTPIVFVMQSNKSVQFALPGSEVLKVLSGSQVHLEDCSGDFGFIGKSLNAASVLHQCGKRTVKLEYDVPNKDIIFYRGAYKDCGTFGNLISSNFASSEVSWRKLQINRVEGCLVTWTSTK